MKKIMQDYEEKYGHIPNTTEEILLYIEDNFRVNKQKVLDDEIYINSLKWKDIEVHLPIIPKPTPRPRYNFATQHFYVTGAGKNKKIIQEFIKNMDIIYTRTHLTVKTYQPTPISSMSKNELYLAEKGCICPLQTPDWDNLGKTYSDMLQDILLLNDNIIQIGTVEKYFSLKPRVEIFISYQEDFDSKFNRRRITSSKAYKKLILPEIEFPVAV